VLVVVKVPTLGDDVLPPVSVAYMPVAVTVSPPPVALKQSVPHCVPPLLKDTEARRDGAAAMHSPNTNRVLLKALTFISSGRSLIIFTICFTICLPVSTELVYPVLVGESNHFLMSLQE